MKRLAVEIEGAAYQSAVCGRQLAGETQSLSKSVNMNIKFDKETDIVYLRFSDAEVAESDEEKPGIIIDYDINGDIVGIELLNASNKIGKPGSLVYEVD